MADEDTPEASAITAAAITTAAAAATTAAAAATTSAASASAAAQLATAAGQAKPPANAAGVQAAADVTANLAKSVPMAFDLGWTMAVVFGYLPPNQSHYATASLPSENELGRADRLKLELDRLDCLLKKLPEAMGALASTAHALPADTSQLRVGNKPDKDPKPQVEFEAALIAMNLVMLEALSCADHQLELAYQVGRSLRDTANPPVTRDERGHPVASTLRTAIEARLKRERINKIQQWLSVIRGTMPGDSAAVISTSVGRWSEFWHIVFENDRLTGASAHGPGQKKVILECWGALLEQGDVWRNLAVGAEVTDNLLTPEAYVAAGEAALSRTIHIVRRVVRHYWAALAILAAATGAIIYLATFLGPIGKVWTTIAAAATSLGVTWKGIGSAVGRLSEAAERPVYRSEQLDAMAWAVTTLPTVTLSAQGVRELRKAGILGSASLGRA